MDKNIKEIISRILEIIAEIESYEFYKNNLLYSSDLLFKEYQRGSYTYEEYNLLLQSLLKGKSKKEWIMYYDSYTYSLLKKIDPLLSQIIYSVYSDGPIDGIEPSKIINILKAPAEPEPSARHATSPRAASSPKPSIIEAKAPEEKQDVHETYEFVEVKRPSIVSKIKETLSVNEPEAAKKESDITLTIETIKEENPVKSISLEDKSVFLDTLKKAVVQKKEEDLKVTLNPEEDRALKKLITHVEEINKEEPKLNAMVPSSALGISVKLVLLKIHFINRLLSAKKKQPYTKEELEEEKAIGYYAKPEEVESKIEEKMPPSVPFKRPSSIFDAFYSINKTISDTYHSIKNSFYVKKGTRMPAGYKTPEAEETPVPEEEKSFEMEKSKVAFSLFAPIKAWYRRREEEQKKFMSKETKVPHSMQAEALKKKIIPIFDEEKVSSTLLTEEVEKIKGIMESGKKFKVYQPSYLGSVANTLVKKFTFYLIDKFPGLFKSLYDSLRLANIRVLSNTYVNIMVLSVIISFIASSVIFSIFFAAVNNPIFILLPKAIVMGLILSVVVFIMFYMYPSIKASGRERNINTNLPFAINHVAAVAGSGVPPTKMFKLLVESQEYGEIAVELGKIVEYVDLFGYDLLTAIRSVSLTVPSVTLKEFLEGIVSTIESGSDIKDYLKEKSSEAMLSYELERQKYLETIATYSDVYTGILIAAPLFFVVALSLVGMLGGKLGGIDINIIIVLGAYVVIPVMNIIFLLFIEVTQPEV
jgi:pilus assembly protein TadC